MNNITLKDALQFLLIETQTVALHSTYGKSVHSIVTKHIEDIEVANKELKVISSGCGVGKSLLEDNALEASIEHFMKKYPPYKQQETNPIEWAKRVTATSIRQSTAETFAIAGSKLEGSINKIQQEFNTDVIWQSAKYCKVGTLSKAIHEAGIAKGDIFKVIRLDHDNKVWVRSDDNFTCWFHICNLLPLSQLEDEPKVTSMDTIRGRKVALELKEFRENLKVGGRVKFKTGLGEESATVKALSGNLVVLHGYRKVSSYSFAMVSINIVSSFLLVRVNGINRVYYQK